MISKRQAIFMVSLCILATKLQRLPGIIAGSVGNEGWLVLLFLGIVDILFLMLILVIFNRHNNSCTFFQVVEGTTGTFLSKVICFIMFAYFLIKALLPFEAIHDLFANVLFDELDYTLFGLIFVGVVLFIATKGLRTLGRLAELYVGLIAASMVGILLLSLFSTKIDNILPIFDTNAGEFFIETIKDNVWFGDYLLLLFLTGNVKLKENEKMGWGMVVACLIVDIIVVPLAYVCFYTLYDNLAVFQTNAISSLTQFSLLTLDIGRVDWFLVLFEQISTICSSAVYIFVSASSLCLACNIKRQVIPIISISFLLFLIDIFVFTKLDKSVLMFREICFGFCFVINYLMPIIYFILSCIYVKKKVKPKSNYLFSLQDDDKEHIKFGKAGDSHEKIS